MEDINVKLKVIKNKEVYEIYVNGNKIDYYTQTANHIYGSTKKLLNALFNTDLSIKEMTEFLIENYLVKDVEDMTNEEFAEYLVENVTGLNLCNDLIKYNENIVYNAINDDIQYRSWHHGLLIEKCKFCRFDGKGNFQSKGNRKQFVSILKQVIEYFDKLEIKLEEESK